LDLLEGTHDLNHDIAINIPFTRNNTLLQKVIGDWQGFFQGTLLKKQKNITNEKSGKMKCRGGIQIISSCKVQYFW